MTKRVEAQNTYLERSIGLARAQQAVLLILGATTLDVGWTSRTVLAAMVAYGIGTFIVVARRGRMLSATDKIFVRWGFPTVWTACVLFAVVIWLPHRF